MPTVSNSPTFDWIVKSLQYSYKSGITYHIGKLLSVIREIARSALYVFVIYAINPGFFDLNTLLWGYFVVQSQSPKPWPMARPINNNLQLKLKQAFLINLSA